LRQTPNPRELHVLRVVCLRPAVNDKFWEVRRRSFG
jgi:hypothetical protein